MDINFSNTPTKGLAWLISSLDWGSAHLIREIDFFFQNLATRIARAIAVIIGRVSI